MKAGKELDSRSPNSQRHALLGIAIHEADATARENDLKYSKTRNLIY